jgi:pimeloyl-ACP methyl ester carboxylesterase
MQEAFFFGRDDARLFGCYHPPVNGDGHVVTIVCPPLFSEYPRTHRALRELALALAQAGQHVLRFDFRGTGDSTGELDQYSITDWVDDVASAVAEARDISDCEMTRMLGVRAGALVTGQAVSAIDAVDRLVLWDPVVDGASYLEELRHAQSEFCGRNFFLGRHERRQALAEHGGYTLSDRMVKQLEGLGAAAYSHLPANKLWVVTSSAAQFPVEGAHTELVPFDCRWDNVATDIVGARPVVEALVACLTRP